MTPYCHFFFLHSINNLFRSNNDDRSECYGVIKKDNKKFRPKLLVFELFLDCKFLQVFCGELLFLLHKGYFPFEVSCSGFGTFKDLFRTGITKPPEVIVNTSFQPCFCFFLCFSMQ